MYVALILVTMTLQILQQSLQVDQGRIQDFPEEVSRNKKRSGNPLFGLKTAWDEINKQGERVPSVPLGSVNGYLQQILQQ